MASGAPVLLLLAASGCSGGGGELAANIGLDMANVAGFVVTAGTAASAGALQPQAGGSGGGSSSSELYALNEDGSLTIVTVTQGGSSSSTATPLAVYDTKTYVLMAYVGVQHGSEVCNWVAAGKADGALYCVTAANDGPDQSAQQSVQYGSPVQADATGNLVWITGSDGSVTLLDLTDPSAATEVTPTGTPALSMAVNASGDALVTGGAAGSQYAKVLFPAGGFFDVDTALEACLVSGASGDPADFYYTTASTVVKLAPASATAFTVTTLGSIPTFSCSAGVAKVGSQLFMTGDPDASETNLLLVVADDAPTTLAVDALATLTQVAGCDASLFILGTDASGNGGLVRYDVADSAFTTLVAPGAYALSTMAVSPGCEVTFYGQRAADGAYVLGTIAAGTGTVTVDATGFPTVTQIDRIN